MFTTFVNACKSFFTHIKNQLKNITKPTTATIAVGALSDLPRSKPDLIAENAILRQQLIVLNRQVKRPQLTPGDRNRLVLMARLTRFWQTPAHFVRPYHSTRHPIALASRFVSSVLEAKIQVQQA
jgi:hypothetical protein